MRRPGLAHVIVAGTIGGYHFVIFMLYLGGSERLFIGRDRIPQRTFRSPKRISTKGGHMRKVIRSVQLFTACGVLSAGLVAAAQIPSASAAATNTRHHSSQARPVAHPIPPGIT